MLEQKLLKFTYTLMGSININQHFSSRVGEAALAKELTFRFRGASMPVKFASLQISRCLSGAFLSHSKVTLSRLPPPDFPQLEDGGVTKQCNAPFSQLTWSSPTGHPVMRQRPRHIDPWEKKSLPGGKSRGK